MGLAATYNDQSDGQISDLIEHNVLTAPALSEPLFAVLDPDFEPASLQLLSNTSLELSKDDAQASGFDWSRVDHAVDLLNDHPGVTVLEAPTPNGLIDYNSFESADQLTGLVIGDNPAELRSSLVEANLPPLLDVAYKTDQLLVHSASEDLDSLADLEFPTLRINEITTSDSIEILDAAIPLPEQSYQLFEDSAFGIALDDLFPLAGDFVSIELQPITDSGKEWLELEQRRPDSTLVERVVIESLFRNSNGQILTTEDLSDLEPGTTVQADLVVTDTRASGLGLIGLELDLDWSSQAAQLKDVLIAQSLPLFRHNGEFDSSAGRLSGLRAASLPSSGTGSVLGDDRHDLFASLSFEIGDAIADGFNLEITPVKLPTSKNQPLDSQQVLTSGSDPIVVIHGLADQSLVGVQQILVDTLDVAGVPWQKKVSLFIENVNDAPEVLPLPPLNVLEAQPFDLDLTTVFSDSDLQYGDQLTFHLINVVPDWLKIDQGLGVLSGQPDQAEVGHWMLQVEARDLSGATARQWLDLTIENVNDAPEWNGDDLPILLVRENQAFSIQLPEDLFSDQDEADQLHFTLKFDGEADLNAWLEVDPVEGVLSGIAPLADAEIQSLTLIATDLEGLSASVPLQFQVVDKMFNRPPYQLREPPLDMHILEGQSVSFDLSSFFGDDDILLGDNLRFEVEAPDWMSFDHSNSIVAGVSDNDSVGPHIVRFRAIDDNGAVAVTSFQITVENVNQAPDRLAPSQDSRLLSAGDEFKLDLDTIFRDVDILHGDSLSYSLRVSSTSSLGLPDWLTWNSRNGELELSPGSEDRGMLTLDFTATDLSGEKVGYQLSLGIVSEIGIIEVNQALQPLRLNQGQTGMLDLQDAFIQLRESGQIDYSFELLRSDSNGTFASVEASDSDWITIVDRTALPIEREDRLIIEPILKLLDTGERLHIEQLSDLEAGDEIELSINVSDLRSLTDLVGFVGLDLDLAWKGLSLSPDNPTDLSQAINDILPLFRKVDQLSSSDQSLRISAGSLPSFGLGEILGDQSEEMFLKLNFLLDDPLQPVQIDLTLNDVDRGGTGYGLADGSSADDLLSIINLSSIPVYELHLNTSVQEDGLYALRVNASASDDSVNQIVPFTIGSGINMPPLLKARPSSLNYYDNQVNRLDLNSLFQDLDGDNLSYSISTTSDNPQHEQLLRDVVHVVYSDGRSDLEFNVPGLDLPVNGSVSIKAIDGLNSVSQVIPLRLNPRSEYIPLFTDPSHPAVVAGQLVGLGDLFSAPFLQFNDSSDEVSLVFRSEQAVELRFSKEFCKLAGLTEAEILFLESTLLSSSAESDQETFLLIPMSKLSGLLPDFVDGFELNWLEIVAPKQHGTLLGIQISTISNVVGDYDGSLYGISQGNTEDALLITTSVNSPKFLAPTTQRYLSNLVDPKTSALPADPEEKSFLVAWKSCANFDSSLSGDLDDLSSIVSLSMSTGQISSLDDAKYSADSDAYQITDLTVRSTDDPFFTGSNVLDGVDSRFEIADSWDPISFTVSKNTDTNRLFDVNTTRDGVQVQVEIDLSGSGLREGDLNAYQKFVSPETIAAASEQGLILRDLDGRPISSSGWYDFTQRKDSLGNPVGDGARFSIETINGERLISQIVLTLTDNSFGDNNLDIGVIDDPGMPIKLVPKLLLPSVSAASQTSLMTSDSTFSQRTLPTSDSASSQRTLSTSDSASSSRSGQGPRSNLSGPVQAVPYSSDHLSQQDYGQSNVIGSQFSGNDATGSRSSSRDTSLETAASESVDSSVRRADQTAISAPIPKQSSDDSQSFRGLSPGFVDSASNSIQALFNRLIVQVESPSALAVIMLGMVTVPNGTERVLRSLLSSGIAHPIAVQRRNVELQAEWPVEFMGVDGVHTALNVCLRDGRLMISSLNADSQSGSSDVGSKAFPTAAKPQCELWHLLAHLGNPGELVNQINPCLNKLLLQPLQESEISWVDWYDKAFSQCINNSNPEIRSSFTSFRHDLSVAFDVDPSFADALMLVQLLDCHIKLGGPIHQFL